MSRLQRIAPCLWFDDQAEAAAEHYVDIFANAEITGVTRYGEVGQEIHGRSPGSVMTVEFVLDGLPFTALNGGPVFKFTEAISLQVNCRDQAEVDYFWERLGDGGDPAAQQCGWLKDRFGVSWQVIPQAWLEIANGPDAQGVERAFQAMFQMKKLDVDALRRAYQG